MTNLELLIDLHRSQFRQGPGGEPQSVQAINLAGLNSLRPLKIADMGCGCGSSSLLLAKHLNAEIHAVDFLADFLEELNTKAKVLGVSDKIKTHACSMEDLPFEDNSLDVIWAEASIYNIGFERGISYWKRFLKPGGKLIVSEITWLSSNRPSEIENYWKQAYPEIALCSSKIALLEQNDYSPQAYFSLPKECWLDNYYQPLEEGFSAFLERHSNSDAAKAIVEEEKNEIALYKQYSDFYSYGFYIATKA